MARTRYQSLTSRLQISNINLDFTYGNTETQYAMYSFNVSTGQQITSLIVSSSSNGGLYYIIQKGTSNVLLDENEIAKIYLYNLNINNYEFSDSDKDNLNNFFIKAIDRLSNEKN